MRHHAATGSQRPGPSSAMIGGLNALAFLGLRRPQVSDPAEVQLLISEQMDKIALFADPVAQNLTGLPATVWFGETTSPQQIVHAPLTVTADPQVGISSRQQWPSLPSARGIPGGVPP